MRKESPLLQRLGFVLLALAVYRLGVHVMVPGLNPKAIEKLFSGMNLGILGLFDTFSGGALSQFSILALGIMPYISASIIMQLMTASFPYLENLKKEGPTGRRKIQQYTKLLTLVLCLIQGYGLVSWLTHASGLAGENLMVSEFLPSWAFKMVALVTLTAGTFFIMWLADQITDRGIGNGSSLIIFTGIAANTPSAIWRFIELLKGGELTPVMAILVGVIVLVVLIGVIVMETAQRRIPIQYTQKVTSVVAGLPLNHLPLKINVTGVIPPIFASSVLLFPATLSQFANWGVLNRLQGALNPSGVIYNVLFVLLIYFFTFFYMEIVFNPKEMAENLKKQGGFIPGVRAGTATAEYLQKIMNRLGYLGATYLAAISVLPVIFTNVFSVPFYFGGTSLLILVGVALDTAHQIQAALLVEKYDLAKNLGRVTIRPRRVEFRPWQR